MTPAAFDALFCVATEFNQPTFAEPRPDRWIAQNKLWEVLGLHPSTICKLLARLERFGWITRTEANPEDRRTRLIRLTASGFEAISSAIQRVSEGSFARYVEGFFEKAAWRVRSVEQTLDDFWRKLRSLQTHFYDVNETLRCAGTPMQPIADQSKVLYRTEWDPLDLWSEDAYRTLLRQGARIGQRPSVPLLYDPPELPDFERSITNEPCDEHQCAVLRYDTYRDAACVSHVAARIASARESAPDPWDVAAENDRRLNALLATTPLDEIDWKEVLSWDIVKIDPSAKATPKRPRRYRAYDANRARKSSPSRKGPLLYIDEYLVGIEASRRFDAKYANCKREDIDFADYVRINDEVYAEMLAALTQAKGEAN